MSIESGIKKVNVDVFQISKELVEEKIQANKMREQYEEEMFELKNKVRIQWK